VQAHTDFRLTNNDRHSTTALSTLKNQVTANAGGVWPGFVALIDSIKIKAREVKLFYVELIISHRGISMTTSRRTWLTTASVSAAAFLVPGLQTSRADIPRSGKLRIGFIADVHQDVMHDGVDRLQKFVTEMNRERVDMIMNLGDFCIPHERNNEFLITWNAFSGAKYHVLGNHDTDGGYKREQAVEYLGMPARYYSFDQQGVHFIVLDGNDPDGKTKGYQQFVAEDQLQWLADDLAKTKLPVVVQIHQPLDCYEKSVKNAAQVRKILEDANRAAGFAQVIGVFAGHQHLDYVKTCQGIPYVQVNSASYVWVAKKHANYDAKLVAKHPTVALTCPYAEPLWALVTLDFEAGSMHIDGQETTWIGPDPWEVGLAEDDYQRNRELSRPAISDYSLKLG
jgi:3',5'-cyclic-AMP phosphodiesterase